MNSGNAELAEYLGLTERRVRQLEDEGVFVRDANELFDVARNADRYRVYSRKDVDTVADEIERLGSAIDAGMNRLYAESDLKKRRKLGPEVAPLIGQIYAAMRLGNAIASPHSRPLLTNYVNMYVGRLIGEYLDVLSYRLADDKVEQMGVDRRSLREKPRRQRRCGNSSRV